jgi:hypothetical protein
MNGIGGAETQDRTVDTAIFSRVLYQLSYLGGGRILSAGPKHVKRGIQHPIQQNKIPRCGSRGGLYMFSIGFDDTGFLGFIPGLPW